ncbi:hypothetical protein ACFQPA_02960 [Halomarina halobia]|uniref:Hsp20/alpha crystallin family protein n=1 Tax=Halomarina halobia TaxID=3033386 RepID=A0ABD6A516_9EURY|nr:hypothetical protein [Halomarina sp. PSR21]
MSNQQRFTEREDPIRRYDYEDSVVFAADLGGVRDADVDVVDGTAIIVIDGQQYEFAVPDGDAQAFIKNGVVTIEVKQ